MLAAERHHQILKNLAESGAVKTVQLAEELQVTDETIRKDFEFLETQGRLMRTHGGAVQVERPMGDLSLTERQMMNRESKEAIAKKAAQRIKPKETIFLDASSTALAITKFLPDFPFTVVTNSLDVLKALGDLSHIDVICTGGLFEAKSRSMIGLSAARTMRRYNIHRMFFSGSGLDLKRGVSERNSRQAAFKESVIEASEDVCLLADETKLGRCTAFFFAECSDLTTLITTEEADKEILASLKKINVNIITA